MSNGAITFSNNNEYYTPKCIVSYFLNHVEYDPATTKEKALEFGCDYYDTIETDGLKTDWTKYKTIWCNPPFTMKEEFLRKAISSYRNDIDIYILLPISFLTTKSFHAITKDIGIKVFLPNGRIKFENGSSDKLKSPAFGSVVIALQDRDELVRVDLDTMYEYRTKLF